MKNLVYILLFIAQWLTAQSFDEGNVLYRKENYAGAVQQYEGVLKQGKESAEVYFNLGNAYYKLNRVAPAIYNYEKALLLNPGNRDAKINIGFAQKMVIDDIKAVPRVGFSKMLSNLTGTYHYDTWAWVAVGLSSFFLLLFIGYYLAGTTLLKRIFFVGMFITILGILISISAAAYVKQQTSASNPAIIFAEVVSVKSEPLAKAQDAFILHEGTKVNVLETVDNWKKIQLADESVGWIQEDALKELK